MTHFGAGLLFGLVVMPTLAGAAEWRVDPAKSRIGFSGVQVGVPFTGRFKTFDAKIDFDPAHLDTSHARVMIDLSSAQTGDTQRDEALPQADWFDVTANKLALFDADHFVAKGGDKYEAFGTLTIRGIRRNVVLPFAVTFDGDKAHAAGGLHLVRTDFHVGQGEWATGEWVALDVGVDIDITAQR